MKKTVEFPELLSLGEVHQCADVLCRSVSGVHYLSSWKLTGRWRAYFDVRSEDDFLAAMAEFAQARPGVMIREVLP